MSTPSPNLHPDQFSKIAAQLARTAGKHAAPPIGSAVRDANAGPYAGKHEKDE